MAACDRAIALGGSDPDYTYYHDSRGIARALVGDYDGALEDFRFFVEVKSESGEDARGVLMREDWIADLEEGRNPIDESTIISLRGPG